MSALAKIQRDFRQFALGHGDKDFRRHIKPANLPEEKALGIYHNNIFSTHFRSLSHDYPLVFSIMGELAARTMAAAYLETSFPCMGSLEDWGGGLIPFIQSYDAAAQWPYLTEIAQYEWAKHVAYGAPEEPLLTPADMSRLITPSKEGPTFSFQKSCQLVAFPCPLKEIISLYQQGQTPAVSEMQGSSYGLVLKREGIIKTHWLEPSLFVFINRLKEGQDMDVAYAAAQVLDPQFDAQRAFTFLLSQPVLRP